MRLPESIIGPDSGIQDSDVLVSAYSGPYIQNHIHHKHSASDLEHHTEEG